MTKILAFAGSTRRDSYNKKVIAIAAAGAREAGAEVTLIDLRDFPMPLYDGDMEKEEGIPENAKRFNDLMRTHKGLLISAPEYNSSISGVLKNTIDWASRNDPDLALFEGKVAALMSASPGALGGLRGLVTLRSILGNIKVLALPDQVAVPKAGEAFNEDGTLKDSKKAESLKALAAKLHDVLRRME